MNKPVKEGFVTDEPVTVDPVDETPTEPAEVPYKEEWPVRVKLLHGKIMDGKNQQIDMISFRAPTGGDINRYGNPVRMDANLEPQIDEKKMTMIMAVLSGINYPNIERMDARDWTSCAFRLRIFFTPSAEGWQ